MFQQNLMHDEEYRSSLVIEARHYQYWETWKVETCSRQVACGEDCSTDSQGRTSCSTKYCTEYYDCSYCDGNNEYWQAFDNRGHAWSIPKSDYEYLCNKWSKPKVFNDLNRDINFSNGCGKDGDMYSIRWGGEVYRTESYNWTASFINRTKLSKTTFKFLEISDADADSLGLYRYPKISNYRQDYILGISYLNLSSSQKDSIITLSKYFNGFHGPNSKLHTFILLFKNKPQDISLKQQSYWEGGNQNELVVCIGSDDKNHINWVHPFSWTDNKRVLIDAREDISEIDSLDFKKVYGTLNKSVNKHFKYKDLDKDFDYLNADLSNTAIFWVWFIVFICNLIGVVLVFKIEQT